MRATKWPRTGIAGSTTPTCPKKSSASTSGSPSRPGITTTGSRPLGFFQGRTSANSLRLAVEEGGFVYSADSYADDLPYWVEVGGTPILVVPYTLDVNDMRFTMVQGFNSGEQFYTYMKDAFDLLYAEGETTPKMMSVGLHPRVVGRPARGQALARFLDYLLEHDKVWVCRRIDIARHWIEHYPFEGRGTG